ncbi:hypothetical protein [Pseudoalteromonas sp. T1lg122]|uniref:hypothetical protein n=1 Tax=Pseudoalteromonas sp. T1lg122 TaxID=2077094 RepID=UPI000CF66129|nr:hypothetical protein [Pseudoalteromonas sp. T1lg122]
MANKVSDEELLSVLFHKTQTRAFLRRVKKNYPDQWLRVMGNVLMATEELRDRKEMKMVYRIGIFDPNTDLSWPWHFSHYDGIYLSNNKRPCKMSKAARFDSKEEARLFFHDWSGNSKYKMELIETREEA